MVPLTSTITRLAFSCDKNTPMDFFDFFPRDHFAEDRFSLLPTGYWPQFPSESKLRYLQLIGLMPDAQAGASYIVSHQPATIETLLSHPDFIQGEPKRFNDLYAR